MNTLTDTVSKQTLSDKAFAILQKMILNQTIAPGTRLKEQHVAKELGISATPVREAFKRLASDGLVEIKPYYGVIVKDSDNNFDEGIYECLVALSSYEMKTAIKHADDAFITTLSEIITQEKACSDFTLFHTLNLKFHRAIWEQTKNTMFVQIMELITSSANTRYADGSSEGQKQIIKNQENILQAFVEKSSTKAHKALLTLMKDSTKIIKGKTKNK